MSSLIGAEPQFRPWSARRVALARWRDAEQLVRDRWDEYRVAPNGTRIGAFAAYMVALHAEEVAARHLASVALAEAA